MDRSSLLRHLRTLADHPGTPAAERDNAVARIAEIEARQPDPAVPTVAERAAARRARMRWYGGGMRGTATGPRRDRTKWPFGWTGARGPVEHEVAATMDGGVAVGWKCPSCGAQVERKLDRNDMLRFRARPTMLRDHLARMTDGTQSTLCDSCWDHWDAN